MPIESTESIKRRMIQNASRIWGYPDTQDINSFDPVVGMILGALADELNSISGEIQKTDSRIVQKLLDLLFKQNIFTHFPSHAIIQAHPVQGKVKVNDSNQFYYRKKIENSQSRRGKIEEKNIHFTPSGEYDLHKGHVKFIAGGNLLYQISDQVKEGIDLSNISKVPDLNNLYIGIEMDRQVEDISGLSLYFSLKNISGKDRFFRSLPSSRWFINDREFKFFQGIDTEKDRSGGLEELFKEENDISYRACRYVNDFFSRFFMTVEDSKIPIDSLSGKDSLPDDMKKHYPPEVLKLIPDDLLWLRIELSQPFSQEMIGELMVSMNCFPVINRGINEFTQSLKKGENIIPLAVEDIFYDVRRISDSRGTEYEQTNSIKKEKGKKNSYILRQAGMARFDSRDALETIDHLTDLVRNESAAFSILGSEMISSEIKELDQIITRLKQRLEARSGSFGTGSFVILNSKNHNERVHVEFWATNGNLANNIRSGSKMNVYKGRDVNANSVILLTNTIGGREELSEEDKLNKLRRALLSKGRIVTREDIKALCFDHFGKDLHTVEIKNGVQAEGGPKKGLVQTLDINLFLKKQHKLSNEDLSHKEEGLKILLKQGSLNMVVYRVFIS